MTKIVTDNQLAAADWGIAEPALPVVPADKVKALLSEAPLNTIVEIHDEIFKCDLPGEWIHLEYLIEESDYYGRSIYDRSNANDLYVFSIGHKVRVLRIGGEFL